MSKNGLRDALPYIRGDATELEEGELLADVGRMMVTGNLRIERAKM